MTQLKKAAFLFALIVCLLSCKKEYSSIGLSMEDDLMGTTMETFDVKAWSVLHDTLNTTNMSNQQLGELHDPVFGKTTASVYAQFLQSGSSPYFGDEPVIDSVVLTLQTAGFYGDTNATLKFEVYELSEDLSIDEDNYYNYSTTGHSSDNLLNSPGAGYKIRPNTPLVIDEEVLSPHLRIRLRPDFGQKLIDESDYWITDDDILEDFKGLYITVSSNHQTGCIFSCNLTSSLSGLTLYYHNTAGEGFSYTFRPSESGISYNNFNHYDYTAACQDLKRQILNHDTTNISRLYLQATAGVRTRIGFPGLKERFSVFNNKVVINRAELVISDCNPSEAIYTHPSGLSIQAVMKDGTLYYIPDDDMLSSDGYFGGTYNASTGEYRIRITQYLQQLILNQGNYADYFYLIVKGSGIHANRLEFYSSNPDALLPNKKLRVEVAYSLY
jgi:hypothetical protein